MERNNSNFGHQTDEELLKTLLRSDEKAKTILAEFGLAQLANAHRRELDLTDASFKRLMLAIELGRRIVAANNERPKYKISSSSEAISFCRHHFATLIREATQEEFHVVTLNTKNVVIDTHQITVGTLDASLVHPREVFRVAIKDVCSSVILAHNHPSGDPTPSREDRAVTDRLEESGKLLGIDVLDHVVMGRDGCVSIREVS
jgi:DNA repair protein RadC